MELRAKLMRTERIGRLVLVLLAAIPLVGCGGGDVSLAATDSATAEAADQAPVITPDFGRYLAAQHAERTNDLAAAAEFMDAVIASDPDNANLRVRALLLTVSEGRYDEAVRHARTLTEIAPSSALGNLILGVEAARDDDMAGLERHLSVLPTSNISGFVRATGLAWARLEQGRVDDALAAIKPMESVSGFATLYYMHLALLNDAAGRPQAAKLAYDQVVKRQPRPPLRIVQVLGNYYTRSGRQQDATALYDRYREDHPGTTLLTPILMDQEGAAPRKLVNDATAGLAETLFNLAGALHQDRDTRTSLVYARLARRLRPESDMIALLVGDILEIQGRFNTATAEYRTIPSSSPFGWEARIRTARNLDQLGDTDSAVKTLRELAIERPAQADPLITLGHVFRGHERWSEAVESYDSGITRLGLIQPHHWSLFYSRGIALERSKRWNRAEEDFLRALELQPDQPFVLNYLGYSWVDRGVNMKRAEDMIVQAVKLRPNDGFIADSLGWVYYRTGRYGKAVVQLERAVGLESLDPTINEHLGDAYWKVGRHAEARFQWERALRLEPESGRSTELEAKLDCGLDGCGVRAQGG